ncbi:MAG: hypothetical protein MJ240_03645 [Kiritimatiellae bacterium]|nr:hypothetical protein [Kiritimatiellia bacterium]
MSIYSRTLLLGFGTILTLSAADVPWATDGVASFGSDLTTPITCHVPDTGLTLSRIFSQAEIPISFTGSGVLTLTAGGTATPPIAYEPVNYGSNCLLFSIPIVLTGEESPDCGVPLLYLGGCTFSNALTLVANTKALSIQRRRASALTLRSPLAIVDFTRADDLEIGKAATDYNGVSVSIGSGASLRASRTTLAKGSSLTLLNSTPPTSFVATNRATGGYADFLMPDDSYESGGNAIYAKLTIQGGQFSCRRLVQGANNGAQIVLSGGTLNASEGIALNATNGAAMTIRGGTIHTPDFNSRGTAAAIFANNATLNVSGFTTEVGRIDVAAGRTLSVTGPGAIAFRQGGTIPRLALSADSALCFLEAAPDVPPLVLGALELPAQKRIPLRVTNRMLSGRTTLAIGITAEHLAKMDPVLPTCARLVLEGDRLDLLIDGADLSQPARAMWIGQGNHADLRDPANWRCWNANDEIMSSAAPTSATALDTITGRTNFNYPESSGIHYPDGLLTGDITLSADCDWRGLDTRAFSADLVVNTAGHLLHLPQMPFPLTGTDIKPCREVRYEAFGARGDGFTDDQPALVKAHVFANAQGWGVRARNDAVYYIGGGSDTIVVKTDVDFGTAQFIIDDRNVQDHDAHIFSVPSTDSYKITGLSTLSRGQNNLGRTFADPCLVVIEDKTTRRYIRSGGNANDGTAQQEVIYVDRNGNVDPRTPILWNYTNITACTAYPIPKRRLTIAGGKFVTYANQDDSAAYYQRNISVSRSNVLIRDLEHLVVEPPAVPCAPYSGFLTVSGAADVTVRDSVFCGHRRTVQGTYDLSATRAIRLAFRNCRQSNSITDTTLWGIFGSNFCKDTLFDGCSFSRFDAHQGVCHATIRNCRLYSINAIGFGTLLVENTTVHSRDFFNLRYDYGSTWEGEFIVRNCTFAPTVAGQKSFVYCTNDGSHDYGYSCAMPKRILVDGLHIADTATSGKLYCFSDPATNATSAAYVWDNPYALTERVYLHNVTSDSGRTLQDNVSPNTWLFRNVVFETDLPPTPSLVMDEPQLGWNLTNANIRIELDHLPVSSPAQYLALTIRDAAGDVVAAHTQMADHAGAYDIQVALPAAGAHYTYSATLQDGPFLTTASITRETFAGSAAPDIWFQANVEGNRPTGVNGTWRHTPGNNRPDGTYDVIGGADFTLSDTTAGSNRTVSTEVLYPVEELSLRDGGQIPQESLVGICAASSETDGAYWCGMRMGPSGEREWLPLTGDTPKVGETYHIRTEIDFLATPPVARYGVRLVGETAYRVLTDDAGTAWHPVGEPQAQTLREIRLLGHGAVGAITGTIADGAVAEVRGVRYDSLNEALAAAKGETVTLLADVAFTPDAATGEMTVNLAGHRLIWQENRGFTFTGNASSGRFRASPTASNGTTANGLGGYASYVLGLNADEPDAQPRLTLSNDQGNILLELTPVPPGGTGVPIRYRLMSSDTLDFPEDRTEFSTWTSVPAFSVTPTQGQRFYRLQLDLARPE